MVSQDNDPNLKSLEDRLKAARTRSKPDDSEEAEASPLGVAWKMGMELVIGVAIGLFIGSYIDDWLDTKPIAMIIMVFFGFGAGLLNVFRDAQRMQRMMDDDDTDPKA